MKHIKHIVLLLSIIFMLFSTISSAYTPSDSDIAPEENVITASDAGGGDLSGSEMAKIILIATAIIIGTLLLIFLISYLSMFI
jgi:hypothetical protein